MRLWNKILIIGILVTMIASYSHAQFYNVVTEDPINILHDVKFISLEDSTLILGKEYLILDTLWQLIKEEEIIIIPIMQITQIQDTEHNGHIPLSFLPTDLNIFRGLWMGAVSGIIGMYAGAGIGYLIGEHIIGGELIGPVFGGGGIGLVVTTTAGLIYFSKHKIGRRPVIYDIAILPFDEKIKQLEVIFADK